METESGDPMTDSGKDENFGAAWSTVLGSVEDKDAIQQLHERLVLRHIAYVNVFRVAMRKQNIPDDEDCKKYLIEE